MGIVNYGDQQISFDFKEPGKSENFNRLNYQLTEKGLYDGGVLTYTDATHISVAPFTVYIEDAATKLGVRIKTANAVPLLVNNTAPYVILRFNWSNTENNYADVLMSNYTNILSDDLIVGKCIFTGATLESTFDYTRTDYSILKTDIDHKLDFKVLPKEPYTNVVSIQGGIVNNGTESLIISTGDSPTFSNTTLGRNDILFMNSDGSFGIIEGEDSSSPVTPQYVAGFMLAEIKRGASATYITGADITLINFNFVITDSLKTEVTNEKRPAIDNTIIPHFIGQEYTNLVQDNCDLRAAGANWIASNTTDELTDIEINGHKFTKIINSGANIGFNYQNYTTAFANLVLTGQVTIKKGSSVGNTTRFIVSNITDSVFIFNIILDWDNCGSIPSTPTEGILLDYNWIDAETFEIYFKCDALTNLTDNVQIKCFGSNSATDAEYTLWTEVQLIDEAEIIMFPFVDGTHAADVIDETFTMPDKFVIRVKFNPRFAYDTTENNKHILGWVIDGTHRLEIWYEEGSDKYQVVWEDGGTVRTIPSQQFDDGTSFTDLNQVLDMIVFLNLTSGGINDSALIVIPQESGAIFINNTFSSTPDVKSSNFPTLENGHRGGGTQADAAYELLHTYAWGGTIPTITSSADAEQYFQTQSMIYEAIPDAFVPREIPVNTPISSALQQITNDMRTGQGIQDGAIIDRHLNATSVDLNTTHRSSDGKNHSDVVLNNTHRTSDGKNHSDVVLNNTHRGSDGKNHSDVVLNNTHRSSDGKNHSDVVLNNTHRSSDGSDHTFIDQDVKTTASPEFEDITIGNIDYIGTPSLIGLLGSGLSVSGAGGPALCSMDSSHIAFLDSAMESLRQYEWNGSTWSLVGSGLTISGIGRPALATLNSTTIVFIDGTLASLRTYSFNGSIWSQVGNSLSIPGVGDVALAPLDSTHIALIGSGSLVLSTYEWDGSDWSLIGSSLSISGILTPAITKLDSSHIAFIADTMESLRQYEWNGSTWSLVGSGLTISGIGRPALASTEKNHVMFIDDILEVLRIYQWTGSTWILIGTPLTISGIAWPALAAMDSNIIYCDGTLDSLRTYEYNHSLKSRRH